MRLDILGDAGKNGKKKTFAGDRDEPEEEERDGGGDGGEGIEPRRVDAREGLVEENKVEREENGYLYKNGEDARERVYIRFAIERERLEGFFFFFALMLLFYLFQFRLELLHGALGARRREGEGEEYEPDDDRNYDNGDTDVRAGNESDDGDKGVVDRIIERRVENIRYHGSSICYVSLSGRRRDNSDRMSPYSISATDDFGKTMSDCGRWSVLRAARTRRFIRCLVTESRATFLDTTTAYPSAFFGRITLKCADETRRPFSRAEGNSERASLFCRGNTIGFMG